MQLLLSPDADPDSDYEFDVATPKSEAAEEAAEEAAGAEWAQLVKAAPEPGKGASAGPGARRGGWLGVVEQQAGPAIGRLGSRHTQLPSHMQFVGSAPLSTPRSAHCTFAGERSASPVTPHTPGREGESLLPGECEHCTQGMLPVVPACTVDCNRDRRRSYKSPTAALACQAQPPPSLPWLWHRQAQTWAG